MIRELKGAINTFRAKLSDHFAFEEEEGGGYLQGVLAARPTLKRKVERLRSDHEVILAALGELVMPTSESESCETLKARFVDAIRYLRRHELEELDLLQDATTRDLGTTD